MGKRKEKDQPKLEYIEFPIGPGKKARFYRSVPMSQIRMGGDNPRTHDKSADALLSSIRAYGNVAPIVVDPSWTIIAGHNRYKTLQKLGVPETHVMMTMNMSRDEAKAYMIADNRITELSRWDPIKRAELIKELKERESLLVASVSSMTAMNDAEIRKIMDGARKPGTVPEMEFAVELGECNQYVVLTWDREVDWLQALDVLGIKATKAAHWKPGFQAVGLGRVMNGKQFIEMILDAKRKAERR